MKEAPVAEPALQSSTALLERLLADLASNDVHAVLLAGVVPGALQAVQQAERRFHDNIGLLAAWPQELTRLAPLFEERTSIGTPQQRARKTVGVHDLESLPEPWAQPLRAAGYRSLLSVRIRVADSDGYRFLLLSRSEVLAVGSQERTAHVLLKTMDAWPEIQKSLFAPRLYLTPREWESLAYTFRGASAEEAAAEMRCAARTVNMHLNGVRKKLGGNSTIERCRLAVLIGLL